MKKLFWLLPLIGAFILLNQSCSTESTPVYQLSTSVEPAEAGSVSQSAQEADEGESITITATPNEHWVFNGWGGDHTGSDNPASVVMDRDKSVTAIFEKRDYPLTIEIEGEGTVKEEVIQEKTTDYPHGTKVRLTAEPADGWYFTEWSGDSESTEAVIEVTIDGQTNVTATFERMDYPLTVTIEGEGEVEQRVVSAPKTTDYPFETEVELTAIPQEGWQFTGWSGDVSSSDEVITVTVDTETNITATFERQEFPLTITIEGEGEVEQRVVSAPKTTDYPFETVVQLTAIPAEGWYFTEWSGDYESTEQEIEVTIDGKTSVTATFERIDYPLTITIVGKGEVQQEVIASKTTDYPFQTMVKLTAHPESGWAFTGWHGDVQGTENPIELEMLSEYTIKAKFEEVADIEVEGEGTVLIELLNDENEQHYGKSFSARTGRRFRLLPFPGPRYTFSHWEGDYEGNEETIIVEEDGRLTNIRAIFLTEQADWVLQLHEDDIDYNSGTGHRETYIWPPMSIGNILSWQKRFLFCLRNSNSFRGLCTTESFSITGWQLIGCTIHI